jgi:hypothetical protein
VSVATTVLRRTNITGYITSRNIKAFELFPSPTLILRETTVSALQHSTAIISNYIAQEMLTNISW